MGFQMRGCELPGVVSSPTPAAHAQRFLDNGYIDAVAIDLNTAYTLIPLSERTRFVLFVEMLLVSQF